MKFHSLIGDLTEMWNFVGIFFIIQILWQEIVQDKNSQGKTVDEVGPAVLNAFFFCAKPWYEEGGLTSLHEV